jgi:hypothetical protein
VFVTAKPFPLSVKLRRKWGVNTVPDLPSNIRLGWKWITATNTLSYYSTNFITAIKIFIVQALDEKYFYGFPLLVWTLNWKHLIYFSKRMFSLFLYPSMDKQRLLYMIWNHCENLPRLKIQLPLFGVIRRLGNTKGGSITVPLTSCLTGLD